MTRPAILKPGDVLLYKGKDWLGMGIDWAEWVDGHENTSYCHAALWYGSRPDAAGLWIIRQNPGGPAFELDTAQPWSDIDVSRLTLADGSVPANDPAWAEDFFKPVVAKHMGDSYAYLEIWDYFGEDLRARLGDLKGSDDVRRKAAAFLDYHRNVCSEFDRIVLGEAANKWLNRLGPELLDILPGVGPGQGRPADLGVSLLLPRVTA